MELRSLRYFISVYSELSFSKAAKQCFVSQPSISTAIAQLEGELGKKLFIRHATGVSPTLAGKEFYPMAAKVTSEIQAMQGMFSDTSLSIELRIALMPYLSGERIGFIIEELIRSIPDLNLTVVGWDEEADARIISKSLVLQNEAFQKLWTDEYVLVMPKNHPLGTKDELVLQDLHGLPFVSRKFCDARKTWNYALRKHGVELVSKATVNTEEYALDLVAAGLGVSLVPSHSAEKREDIVTRIISNVHLERVVGLAYRKDLPLSGQFHAAMDSAQARFDLE